VGRRLSPRAKICRRYGVNLYASGDSSTSLSRTLAKRNYPPGVHGVKGRPKLSGYGEQLVEKQKAKLMYGILERQFSKYYREAIKRKGEAGQNLLNLLEFRLDNVVYRLGFATTRAQARQMVSHALVEVNGKKVNIPSYQVKVGDVVAIREIKRKLKLFTNISERLKQYQAPAWLALNPENLSGKVLDVPGKDDKEMLFNVRAIIEFYSR